MQKATESENFVSGVKRTVFKLGAPPFMVKLNDLRIQKKLIAAFAVVIAAIVAMGLTVFLEINAIEKARSERLRATAVQSGAENAITHLIRQENQLRAYLLSRDDYYVQALNEERQDFITLLDKVAQLEPAHAAVVAKAKQDIDLWSTQALAGQTSVAAEGAATDLRSDNATSIARIESDLQAIITVEAEESRLAGERQDMLAAQARSVLIIGCLLALAIALGAAFALTQMLAKPLVALAGAMRRLSAGDIAVTIPAMGRKDEVGEMATAVQAFKDAALAKVRLEEENAAQQAAARAETERLEAIAAKETADSVMAITALGTALSQLAAGDLAYRIDADFPAKAAKLKADFNAAIIKLDDALGEVTQNVVSIRAGANEISQASDDLSNRTEQQAASLEETAAALDQITATVRRTAEGARQASSVVQSARGDAEQSGQVVQEAVEAMSAIEQSSVKIDNIIGVIDEIAFQTNLLALNAGVEAARAGEAGRGFAVVASEVRALAQRSADAAKEIKTLISASGRQVGSGVNLVGQTGEALQRIVSRVADIDSLVSEIAASAQEQATGLQEVNSAVNQMDQVTQQNAAMVEQATAASHSMASEAEALDASVQRFRISQPATRAPARVPAKPVMATPRARADYAAPVAARRFEAANAPVQAQVSKPVAETLAALKTTGRGGAALKPQAVEDGWEEF